MLVSWDPEVIADLVVILVALIVLAFAATLALTVWRGGNSLAPVVRRKAAESPGGHGAVVPSDPEIAAIHKTDGLESFRWALAVREDALGPDHLDVATACHVLGAMYAERELLTEAEPLLQRALNIRIRALGGAHRDVALTIDDLANLYRAQGRHVEAEALLDGLAAVQGTDRAAHVTNGTEPKTPVAELRPPTGHGDRAAPSADPTAWSDIGPDELRSIAPNRRPRMLDRQHAEATRTLRRRGRNPDAGPAEELYRRELAIIEASGATDNPELRRVLRELGSAYYRRGAYAEAEPLLERALALAQGELGLEALEVMEIREQLAWLRFSRRSLPGG